MPCSIRGRIGQDADDDEAEIVGAKAIDALRDEITALRTEIQSLGDFQE